MNDEETRQLHRLMQEQIRQRQQVYIPEEPTQEELDAKLFEKSLMVHDWPECGPGSMDVESLYQTFKRRLMAELVAQGGSIYDTTISRSVPQTFALVAKPDQERTE